MEKKGHNFIYYQAQTEEELSDQDQILYSQAVEAMGNAYAPYSKFKVGCALLLANGELVKGNNQENMAYPSGMCAERVAVFSASANFPLIPIKTLAVVAKPLMENNEITISPCGSCRQVLMEYEQNQNKPIKIIMGSVNGFLLIIENASSLLPLAFHDPGLKKN